MADILIKKGHNIRILGVPKKEIVNTSPPASVALKPADFNYIKPKLVVNEGDTVKIGSPIFFDKKNPDIKWASPAAGTISQIIYGERRIIQRIVITPDSSEEFEKHKSCSLSEILSLDRQQVIDHILEANLWPLIRQRPYNKVADPKGSPKAIFISGLNTAPLSVDIDLALQNEQENFQAGLNALTKLTDGVVHLTIDENATSAALTQARHVKVHTISGPHPAGNVGIQIHHIDPINLHDTVWALQAQHVVILGKLFLTGQFDPAFIATIGGPAVTNPVHVTTRMGASIESIAKDHLQEGDIRIISGDVLTGTQVTPDGFLSYYDSTVSVIPEKGESEFLGFLLPGSAKSRYSLTRAFTAFKKIQYKFTAMLNGSERAIVPINAWEDVLPMDILPNFLYRSILAQDIEEMEKLGILECDEEDFALCSFACPSKIDVGKAIRSGLDLIEAEG